MKSVALETRSSFLSSSFSIDNLSSKKSLSKSLSSDNLLYNKERGTTSVSNEFIIFEVLKGYIIDYDRNNIYNSYIKFTDI